MKTEEKHMKSIQTVEDFISLQKDQLNDLKTAEFPDILKMKEDRALAFSRMKKLFTGDPDFTTHKDQARLILELDAQFKDEIHKYKVFLKNRLSQLRQGKNALAGYKNVNCINHNKPHVFSMSR